MYTIINLRTIVPKDTMNTTFENIQLDAKELKGILDYKDSFGEDWCNRSIHHRKARKYVEINLQRIEEESKFATPFNCYHTGHEVFKRKDGNPITQNDLDALSALVSGQGNKVTGQVGDNKAVYDWECDSGD